MDWKQLGSTPVLYWPSEIGKKSNQRTPCLPCSMTFTMISCTLTRGPCMKPFSLAINSHQTEVTGEAPCLRHLPLSTRCHAPRSRGYASVFLYPHEETMLVQRKFVNPGLLNERNDDLHVRVHLRLFWMLHRTSSYSSEPYLINTDGILLCNTNTNPIRLHSKYAIPQVKRNFIPGAIKIQNTKISPPHTKIRCRHRILL